MLLFSNYLINNNISYSRLANKQTKNYFLLNWLGSVFESLKYSLTLLPDVSRLLEKTIKKELNKYLKIDWDANHLQENISAVDNVINYFYLQLVNYARFNSTKNPINPSQPYSYNRQHSGVSINAYIIFSNENNSLISSEQTWEAHDSFQCRKQGINLSLVCQQINDGLTESPLSDPSKQLIARRCKADSFHAEDYWFSTQLTQLLAYLETHRSQFPDKRLDDDMWLQQIHTYPRIEIVVSSSPCEDCKSLFINLRHILNNNQLFLPIIIFANTPYNTNEILYSPIILIKFDGSYFFSELCANLPYYKDRMSSIAASALSHGLFSRDERSFTNLENSVNKVMPVILNSSLNIREKFVMEFYERFFSEGTINFTTLFWFQNYLKRLTNSIEMPDWIISEANKSDKNVLESALALREHYGEDYLTDSQEIVEAGVEWEVNNFLKY